MLTESQFAKDLKTAKKLVESASRSIDKMELLLENNDRKEVVKESFNYEITAERIANNARLIPMELGDMSSKPTVENQIIKENNVKVCYLNKNTWFYVKIPSLLPKKEKGDASFIRATLATALKDYFSEHEKIRFSEESTIIFRHNYSEKRPQRQLRDHDNIEVNVVIDQIALYVLVDDNPFKLRHYYCSKMAKEDCTEIFVMPNKYFTDWIKEEK